MHDSPLFEQRWIIRLIIIIIIRLKDFYLITNAQSLTKSKLKQFIRKEKVLWKWLFRTDNRKYFNTKLVPGCQKACIALMLVLANRVAPVRRSIHDSYF